VGVDRVYGCKFRGPVDRTDNRVHEVPTGDGVEPATD
jgi:hypothetical protein